ncbi:MAG: glycosyltransferase [Acidimicrobiales bacterium]
MLLGLPRDSVTRLPYAVDNDAFAHASSEKARLRDSRRRQWGLTSAHIILLCVAKFSERERPLNVIQAFLALSRQFPDARLVLVGDGPQRTLISDAAFDNGSDRVILPGYVPYRELPEVFTAADIFVHLPTIEPWGLSVNEAAASQLPIITSRNVGASFDLVVDGYNGFVVDSSLSGIEAGLAKILSLPTEQLRVMGSRSASLSEKVHYRSWATSLKQLASFHRATFDE